MDLRASLRGGGGGGGGASGGSSSGGGRKFFGSLLEQRRAPIDAATIAREHVAEVDALRGTIAEVRGALEAEAARDAAEARARSLDSASADAAKKRAETAEQRLALERENAQTLAKTVASFAAQFDRKCDALENARRELEGLARRTKFATLRVGLIAALRDVGHDSDGVGQNRFGKRPENGSPPTRTRRPPNTPPTAPQNVVRELEVEITRLQSERHAPPRAQSFDVQKRQAMRDAATRAERAEAEGEEAQRTPRSRAPPTTAGFSRGWSAPRLASERLGGECLSLLALGWKRETRSAACSRRVRKGQEWFGRVRASQAGRRGGRRQGGGGDRAKSAASGLRGRRTRRGGRRRERRWRLGSVGAIDGEAARAVGGGARRRRRRVGGEGGVAGRRREGAQARAKTRCSRTRARAQGAPQARGGWRDGGSRDAVDSTPNASAKSSPARSSPPGRARASFRDENAAPTTDGGGKVAAAGSVRERYDERYDERSSSPKRLNSASRPTFGFTRRALLESRRSGGDSRPPPASPRPGVFRNGHDATTTTTYDPSSYASPPRVSSGIAVSMEDLEKAELAAPSPPAVAGGEGGAAVGGGGGGGGGGGAAWSEGTSSPAVDRRTDPARETEMCASASS